MEFYDILLAKNRLSGGRIVTPVSIEDGGTGATTASEALSNLGGVPSTRTINGETLAANISLDASDVGAVPTTRTVNSKALSSDITLSASDVGAAATLHSHSANDITSGTLPIARGGTGATTASEALSNLGGVPSTRTINGETLAANISLDASDVGAVPTTRTVNSKALSSDITLSASDVGAAATLHSHSANDITSGTLPIARGGTGATTASEARTNLDIYSKGEADTLLSNKADKSQLGYQILKVGSHNFGIISANTNSIIDIDIADLGFDSADDYEVFLTKRFTGSNFASCHPTISVKTKNSFTIQVWASSQPSLDVVIAYQVVSTQK